MAEKTRFQFLGKTVPDVSVVYCKGGFFHVGLFFVDHV